MKTYEEIIDRIECAIEGSEFTFDLEDCGEYHGWIFRANSPAGEDISFEGRTEKEKCGIEDLSDAIVFEVDSYANGYDADEHAELWISHRGENGAPSSIRELIDDADAIGEMYLDLARRLKEHRNDEPHEYDVIVDFQISERIKVKALTPESAIDRAMREHEKTKASTDEYLYTIKAFVNSIDGELTSEEYVRYFD